MERHCIKISVKILFGLQVVVGTSRDTELDTGKK
jgi:hypothetical protein